SSFRFARFGADPVGTEARRTVLYAEPVAGAFPHPGDRSSLRLWPVARLSCGQSTSLPERVRHATLARSRRWVNRLLFRLCHWCKAASRTSRETPRRMRPNKDDAT